MSTLPERLIAAAQTNTGVRFLDRREEATWLGYDQILARAQVTAAGLARIGVQRGDRVAIILPTGPAFYDAFFGALGLGAIPVPLYPPVRLGRLDEYHQNTAELLKRVDACVVVTDVQIRRVLGRSVAQAKPALGCHDIAQLRAEPIEFVESAPDDIALIQFSSGTTGVQKPVALTHAQILANAQVIIDAIRGAYPEDETFRHSGVSWLPLYHDMGLIGCVVVAIVAPGDLTLLPPELFVAKPASWLRAISRYRASVSPAPNFAYALASERIQDKDIADVDLSSWRLALNGAEPVTAAALSRFVTRFRAFGLRPETLTPVYGLAEAALAVTFSEIRRPFRASHFDSDSLGAEGNATLSAAGRPLVSVGKALPGYEIKIVSSSGAQAKDGTLGRILVRGPSIMRGYDGDEAATRAVLRGGWLDTGDTGFVHDGELFIYGRSKDLVLVRGRKYAPQQIEHVVDGVAGVRRGCSAAVSAAQDGDATEELWLFVERHNDTPPQVAEDVKERVRRTVIDSLGLVPKLVVMLDPGTLPRTSSGKIRRREALQRYRQGKLRPPTRVGPMRMISEMLSSSWHLRRGH